MFADDTRLAEPYRDLLVDAGCTVDVHDPHVLEYPGVDISHELSDVVKGADVVAILTGHDEYFSLDAEVLKGLMGPERPVVVDGRNVVDADEFISIVIPRSSAAVGCAIATFDLKISGGNKKR